MFDSSVIVQSAISAFNNSALVAPAFLWWGLLALPLFVLVYLCAGVLINRIGWNSGNFVGRASLTTVIMALAWIVLFGGNYGVLRDSISVLPFAIATIVFVASLFVGTYYKTLHVPSYRTATRAQKISIIGMWALILMAVGLSDVHVWWGPLLQIGALVGGLFVGRAIGREMRPVAGVMLVLYAITVVMLMQPEFFRFGQLGALTPVHLLFLILMAGAIAGTVALRNVKPRGRIRHSAYVKLKWLARFMAGLCIALFILTESVLVFVGMSVMLWVLFAMSVWHAETVPAHTDELMYAIVLVLFGVLTTMPFITAIGIMYWVTLPHENAVRRLGFLL